MRQLFIMAFTLAAYFLTANVVADECGDYRASRAAEIAISNAWADALHDGKTATEYEALSAAARSAERVRADAEASAWSVIRENGGEWEQALVAMFAASKRLTAAIVSVVSASGKLNDERAPILHALNAASAQIQGAYFASIQLGCDRVMQSDAS